MSHESVNNEIFLHYWAVEVDKVPFSECLLCGGHFTYVLLNNLHNMQIKYYIFNAMMNKLKLTQDCPNRNLSRQEGKPFYLFLKPMSFSLSHDIHTKTMQCTIFSTLTKPLALSYYESGWIFSVSYVFLWLLWQFCSGLGLTSLKLNILFLKVFGFPHYFTLLACFPLDSM